MRTMLTMTQAAAAVVLLVLVQAASAEDAPSVDEIIRKSNHVAYYQGEDGRARVKMTITDSQGNTREREFTILRRNMDDEDREQRFYVYFHSPADVREMVFLVWKYVDRDDNRWLYLPGLDVVRQIAAGDKRTSFVGSAFFYEDVSGRGIQEDDHELVEVTDNYYVIKSTPKNPGTVEFDAYTMHIHKSTFIPVRVEYEKNGNVYRIGEARQVDTIQGFPTVTRSAMKDVDSGTETTLEYLQVEYNVGLPDTIFTERFMRRAPRQHLN